MLVLASFVCSLVLSVAAADEASGSRKSGSEISTPLEAGLDSFREMEEILREVAERCEGARMWDCLLESKELSFDRFSKKLCMWMVREGMYPMVSMTGFVLVKRRFPDVAFEAALEALLAKGQHSTIAVYELAVKELGGVSSSEVNLGIFTKVSQKKRLRKDNIANVLFSTGRSFLLDWLRRVSVAEILRCNSTFQAVFVSIISESVRDGLEDSSVVRDKIGRVLSEFAKSDGLRLCVYLETAPKNDDRLIDLISKVLVDQRLENDDLRSVVVRHKDLIRERVPFSTLRMPARRLDLVNEMVGGEEE